MRIMKRRMINLSEESYLKIKSFCKERNLKISKWCEKNLILCILMEIKNEKIISKKLPRL